jgi:signal transduction histidine kinase
MKLYSIQPLRETSNLEVDRIHVLSHELRTPLAVISGYAQILKEEVDPGLHDVISPIIENVERLNQVINSLLTWESTELGGGVTPENCEIVTLVSSVADKLRSAAAAKSIDITVTGRESRIASYAATNLIESVVKQLIDNAIKFSESGSIHIQVFATSTNVTIRIEDQGMGLTEKPEKLFEPFVQGSTGLNREHDGLGLGLALAQKAAIEVSGKVSLENGQEKGAVASFSFPRFAAPKIRDIGHRLAA